jgi:hypothetical protein
MPLLDEPDPSTVTPPPTEAPTTPRSHSRNLSFGTAPLPGSVMRDNTRRTGLTPFPDNKFTSVSADHVLLSPTHKQKSSGNKRDRDTSGGRETGSAKKKRAS